MLKTAIFNYTNYRGDVEQRRVFPRRLEVATDKMGNWGYVPGQYLLLCYDFNRKAMRSFAISKITNYSERDQTQAEADQYSHFVQAMDSQAQRSTCDFDGIE